MTGTCLVARVFSNQLLSAVVNIFAITTIFVLAYIFIYDSIVVIEEHSKQIVPHRKTVIIGKLTRSVEYKNHSQNGEDGIISKIFKLIGVTNKFYVEFGTQNGSETNTRVLRESANPWKGLLMDGNHFNLNINLHKEFIYHSNVVSLFEKYDVPNEFDLLSTDTDFKDFWISDAIFASRKYKPRVIISEINSFFAKDLAITVPKNHPQSIWSGNRFTGASTLAMTYLYQSYNYSLVYCEHIGVNCFWISNDELSNAEIEHFNDIENIMNLIQCSRHGLDEYETKALNGSQWWTEIIQIVDGNGYGYYARKLNLTNAEVEIKTCKMDSI